MSNLITEGAKPVRPPRTKDILDRKTGKVIGSQTQSVYLLASVANALLRFPNPGLFDFNKEANYDGNVVPAHHKGRYRTVDIFLQAGIKPAAELVGRVEVKAFVTTNTYSDKATGEDEVREDSENDYLRITFVGPADESEPRKLLEVHPYPEPKDIGYEDAFGYTKKDVAVFIGVVPKEAAAAEPFNPAMVVPPAPATTPTA